jgi:hypothetical protein
MEAMNYEILVRRAFKCERFGHAGANTDIWTGLVTAECQAKEPKATQKDKGRYENELREVKNFVGKAFVAAEKELTKRQAGLKEIAEIQSLKIASDSAIDASQLSEVIRQGLDKFIDYKIEIDK